MTGFIFIMFLAGVISLIIALLNDVLISLIPKIEKIYEKQENRIKGLLITILCPFILGFLVSELRRDLKTNSITVRYKNHFLPAFISILILHHWNGIVLLITNKSKVHTYYQNGVKTMEYGSFIIKFTSK